MKFTLCIIFFVVSYGTFSCNEIIKSENQEKAQYESQLSKSVTVRLIDSILHEPLSDGNMSTFEKSGYGIRAYLLDSLRKDLLDQLQLKMLSLTNHTDYEIENKFYEKIISSIDTTHYYTLYTEQVWKQKKGCAYPSLIPETSTEWSDDYKRSKDVLTITIKNNCAKGLKAIIVEIIFTDDKNLSIEETNCRYVKKIPVTISAYSEGKINIPVNPDCPNFQKPRVELLSYYTTDGKKEVTGNGIMYQWDKESLRSVKSKRGSHSY